MTMQAKVLVVDDEPSVLKAIQRIFRHSDMIHLILSGDPVAALNIALTSDIDLIVTDQQMPGMTGLQLLAQLNEKKPEMVKIILTGMADVQTAVQAINEVGVYKFILKPWNNDDLYWTVVRTVEMILMQREKAMLVQEISKKDACLRRIENIYPGISDIKRDEDGTIVIDDLW
ncbi:MAG: response regulator [Deltaproteobacteria bacterium]|nr:response regulator [Candidatus Anaeroferrophillus wilburensis]MBN2889261.1 response regulator [Deltaproteobacteria bacterium]